MSLMQLEEYNCSVKARRAERKRGREKTGVC